MRKLKTQAYDSLGRPLYMHSEVSDEPLFPRIHNPDNELTDVDREILSVLYSAWMDARNSKNYVVADVLRKELTDNGCIKPQYDRWMSFYETMGCRNRRLERRNK